MELFSNCQTQWNYEQGTLTGLNYQGVHAAAAMMGIKGKKLQDTFWRLQVLETATLECLKTE